MSIFEYNGAAIIAMAGKECVAIGCDLRFGVQRQTISTDYKKVHRIHDQLYIGLAGLGTDAQTLTNLFRFRHNLYRLREERNMRPTTFSNFVSSILYEKRFGSYFVSPVIAGLEPDGTPYLSSMDSIGAQELAKDFVCSGTYSTIALSSMCRVAWMCRHDARSTLGNL